MNLQEIDMSYCMDNSYALVNLDTEEQIRFKLPEFPAAILANYLKHIKNVRPIHILYIQNTDHITKTLDVWYAI